jgi:hypothetical protein
MCRSSGSGRGRYPDLPVTAGAGHPEVADLVAAAIAARDPMVHL